MNDGITIITKPEVYVLGKQVVQSTELERFLRDHGVEWSSDSHEPAEVLTETAGRICYMSFARPRPGGNSAYLNHIKEVGHGSVLEHGVWNLLLTGISRSLTHELVRHRAGWAYSQVSQRYVDESVAEYVVPPDLQEEMEAYQPWQDGCVGIEYTEAMSAYRTWKDAIEHAHAAYVCLSEYLAKKAERRGLTKTEARKFARQAARSVLPNATETKIFVTANARALRHAIEQRCSRHAEPEIRKLFGAIWEVLNKDSPNLFGDYKKIELLDGTYELITDTPKV